MAKPSGKLPFYKALVNRFSHLAANASDDDEEKRKAEERKAREEGDEEEDEEEAGISEEEKEARHSRNEKRRAKAAKPCRAEEDDEDDDDESPEAKARASERARWGEVLGSPEAKGRVPLACSLLADTGMSPEKIRAALSVSPVEARQGLAARMAAIPRPEVGSGGGATAAAAAAVGSPKAKAAEIVASYNKVVGA